VRLPGDEEEEEWVVLPAGGQGPQEQDAPPQEQGAPRDAPQPQSRSQPQRLERGISKVPANVAAAARLRSELAQELERVSDLQEGSPQARQQRLMHSNFFLPELSDQPAGFKEYILSKLTAPHYQRSLEEACVLNWALGRDLGEEHRLFVLWAQADGNCLLHAGLLAMWGLHDTHQVGSSGLSSLRAAMSRLFAQPGLAAPMRRRWAVQMARDNAWQPTGGRERGAAGRLALQPLQIEVSDEQLEREWDEMTEIANKPNAFLDSVHVLAMAHALRRPIVVLASAMQKDPFGIPLTPIFFRGIYLPFERPPRHCCRQPLILCFQDSHFMPLVPTCGRAGSMDVRVPLADGHGEELPLRFALEHELKRKWELVESYMDVAKGCHFGASRVACTAALLSRDSSHPLVEEMLVQFMDRGHSTFAAEHEAAEAARRDAAQNQAQRMEQQEAEDRRLAQKLAGDGSPGGGVEEDAEVTDRFNVKLPRSARPGDKSFFTMPAGCTEPSRIDFAVPSGCYGGDVIVLTARFKVHGSSIQTLRDATGLPRDGAVALLAAAHGDANVAAQRHFEKIWRS